MLNNFFLTFKCYRFFQSGMYLDCFIKKLSEVFIKNVFIYTFQFFFEKFLIEYFFKNCLSFFLFTLNSNFSTKQLNYSSFFFKNVFFLFFFLFFFNCGFLFFLI